MPTPYLSIEERSVRNILSLIGTFIFVVAVTFLIVMVIVDINSPGPPDPMIEKMVRGSIGIIALGLLRFAAGILGFAWRVVYLRARKVLGA
jgi:hypothetical protein